MDDSKSPIVPKPSAGSSGPQSTANKSPSTVASHAPQDNPKSSGANEKEKEKPKTKSLLMKLFGERPGFLITLFLVGAGLLYVSTFFPEKISLNALPTDSATGHADAVSTAFYYAFEHSVQSSEEILSNTVKLILQAIGGTCLATTALYYLTTFKPLQDQINNYFITAFTNRDYLRLVQDHHKQEIADKIIRDLYESRLPEKYLVDYISELNNAAESGVCSETIITLRWQRTGKNQFLQSIQYHANFENYSSSPRSITKILETGLFKNFVHIHKEDFITLQRLLLSLPSQSKHSNRVVEFDDEALKPLVSENTASANVVKHQTVSWDELKSHPKLSQKNEVLPRESFTCDAMYTRTCFGFDPVYTFRFRHTCAAATFVAILEGNLAEEYDVELDLFGDGIVGIEVNPMPEKDFATGKITGKRIQWANWLSPGSGFSAVLVERQPIQPEVPSAEAMVTEVPPRNNLTPSSEKLT